MAKLLLAEDEPVLRMLIVDTLEDEGHEVEAACDGEEALGKLLEQTYDLVILDYMMPKLTGIEVTERLRAMADRQSIKILMLSAKNQQDERSRIWDAGVDGFMPKPFSPLELAAKVEELLNG